MEGVITVITLVGGRMERGVLNHIYLTIDDKVKRRENFWARVSLDVISVVKRSKEESSLDSSQAKNFLASTRVYSETHGFKMVRIIQSGSGGLLLLSQ